MTLNQYTPHLVTGASLLMAIVFHWRLWRLFWRPSLFAAVATSLVSLFVVFGLQDNYLNFAVGAATSSDVMVGAVVIGAIAFGYGLIIALLIGYVIKIAPSFFD